MRFLFLGCILIISLTAYSQEYHQLYDSARRYYASDPTLCIEFATQAMSVATSNIEFANANFLLGSANFNSKNNTKALMYYFEALRQYQNINDKKMVSDVKLNIAVIFKHAYTYDKALKLYKEVADLKAQVNDRFLLAETYRNIAKVYRLTNNFDSASIYNTNALKIYTELDNKPSQAIIYNELGILYKEAESYDTAIHYYFIALRLDPKRKAKTYNNAGNAYLGKNDFIKAKDYLLKSLDLKQAKKPDESALRTLNNLAETYRNLNSTDSALHYLNLASISNDTLSVEFLRTRELLVELYRESGEIEKAFAVYEQINKYARDVAQVQDYSNKMHNFYELQAGLSEVEKIEKDKVAQKERFQLLLIIGLSIAATIIISLALFRLYRGLKKEEAKKAEYKKAILKEFRR
ncbi:tetratricopeptide repeat protein [Fulvivirga sp. 29W222]|uniref:Tetratricopeptide repeat protein n=1 Tax=Fulvivirga marina TaxID=2494733 RepID=A0A937G228_9BACT|nr:tetratricopeptide repeat protein [Fulvivirga marina]MBL6448560.1 tetratricopeptide repeat protein [Fulvivirga marina]